MGLISLGGASDKGKVNAVLVFDVIGRPPEHLVGALNSIVEEISKEKGVVVLEKKVNEPVVMKDREDFFTTFAEVEVEVEKITNLVILMFKYMPAHIEVISPQELTLSNSMWTEVLSEITRRLHGYEEIARILQTEKGILENKLREALQGNNVSLEKGSNPKNTEQNKESKENKKTKKTNKKTKK